MTNSLSFLAAATGGSGRLNPLELFLQADIVVQAVMVGLLLASVWVWMIIISFSLRMGGLERKSRQYEEEFWETQDYERMLGKRTRANLPMARVAGAGLVFLAGLSDPAGGAVVRLRVEPKHLNRNGTLTENDVATVLDLSSVRSGQRVGGGADAILFTPTGGTVKAKTPGQSQLVEAARGQDIVFAVGPAGTGKTYTAVALAVSALKSRQVKKIVLCRPAVEAGESLGFLPGDFRDKIDPYLRPLYDALEDMMPRDKLAASLDQNTVEIVPLAYMRGRTLSNAFVILDEAQNATTAQMKMFLTRLGPGSRCIVTGDVTQTDLPRRADSGEGCALSTRGTSRKR